MTEIVHDEQGLTEPVDDAVVERMLPRPHKALLAGGAILCALVAWWLARVMHVPAFPGFSARLLGQPAPLWSLACVYLVAAVCACVGAVVCGVVRYDAPLFC